MNLPYLVPRLIRHFMPEKLVRALLLHSWIIRPGLETSNAFSAVQGYKDALSERGLSFQDKRVLIFGYGGRFDIGLGILKEGATHVILCDKFAPLDEIHNRRLFSTEEKYFIVENNKLRPRSEWITLVQEDIQEARGGLEPVEIVVSNAVYEHLDDVEGVTSTLTSLTKPDGCQIHFIDLRDHFFKYPFEMLSFTETMWRKWLNPSSNHNRYRLWDYRRVFELCFANVEVEILSRDEEAFRMIRTRILPEFISGNMVEDAATTIRVFTSKPLKS